MAKSKQGPKKKPAQPEEPALDEALTEVTSGAIHAVSRNRVPIIIGVVVLFGLIAIPGILEKSAEAGRAELNERWFNVYGKYDDPLTTAQFDAAMPVAKELIETDLGPVVAVELASAMIASEEEGVDLNAAFELVDLASKAHPDAIFLKVVGTRVEAAKADQGFEPPQVAEPEPAPTTDGDANTAVDDAMDNAKDAANAAVETAVEAAAGAAPTSQPTSQPAGDDSSTGGR